MAVFHVVHFIFTSLSSCFSISPVPDTGYRCINFLDFGTGTFKRFVLLIEEAAWLYYGYRLEILGDSVFFPQLWGAGMGFFAVNVGILGNILSTS